MDSVERNAEIVQEKAAVDVHTTPADFPEKAAVPAERKGKPAAAAVLVVPVDLEREQTVQAVDRKDLVSRRRLVA